MSNRTGYDYIPAPGEPYYPQGKPVAESQSGTVIAENDRNKLIKTSSGDVVLTDKKGKRTGDS